ncbi:sulfatase-like hydrolase/transferase [Streptomyces sp. NPDC047999]|uniref:sulfatase-like hydrolase/transferase n=1 Tax=Streptomyces sp. NPDC047999 TaxID=3365497 RepID=UPI0037204A92
MSDSQQPSRAGSEPAPRSGKRFYGIAAGLVAASLLAAGIVVAATDGPPGGSGTSPNILMVIADDFGVDASPCYDLGEDKPDMPTLESLCGSGLVFDQAWVNTACTPTRATFLTGQYGIRTGVGSVDAQLPTSQTTIQRVLAERTDYASAVIGKWHVGGRPNQVVADHPGRLGVPYYAGFLSGAMEDYRRWPLTVNGQTHEETAYATTKFTDLALDWIEEQDGPWFTWLAYTAPHTPFHLPPAELHSRDELTGTPEDIEKRPKEYYFAAAEAMDHELGRLLDGLPDGERENTTVIFVGDNGTPQQVVQSYPRGHAKGSVYQGGVHVPLVVSGASVPRTGEREDALVNGADLYATLSELAGATGTGTGDSVSIAPLLTTAGDGGRAYAYTEAFGQTKRRTGTTAPDVWAIRDSRYKLVHYDDGREELYDLSDDPLETRNILAEQPAAVARLRSQAENLRRE